MKRVLTERFWEHHLDLLETRACLGYEEIKVQVVIQGPKVTKVSRGETTP